jgi:hypothetical protein
MTIMASHSSATVREPHVDQTNQTTRTGTIINALKQRARAVLNDQTIDPQSRVIIRYALETNDPWLAELVRRADANDAIVDAIDFSETPDSNEKEAHEGKITTLAEMICRAGDEPELKSAALLILMATLENAPHPKVLANLAKHLAFTRCGELNHNGMVDAQVAVLESELFV